jgi:hypothetical protein
MKIRSWWGWWKDLEIRRFDLTNKKIKMFGIKKTFR